MRAVETDLPITLAELTTERVPWGPIGETVYKRTYSQTKENQQKEIWAETVIRAVEGNLGLVDKKFVEPDEREKLIRLLFPFGALPGGRHLNASGMKGRQFLFNCLQADTTVLTKKYGWTTIKSLVGEGEVEVLSQGSKEKTGIGCWTYGTGEWRKATFSSFGKQKLLKVTFSDGSSIEATPDHKWYVTKRANPIETKDLAGHMVPLITAEKPERNADYSTGVLHGFVYGDGTVNTHAGKTYSANVQLFGEKDKSMIPLFEKAGHKVTYPDYCDGYVGCLPAEWKAMPSQNASKSYWRGFISGLITADGTVDKSGSVFIYQANKGALEEIRKSAMLSGFSCTPVMLQREKSPFTGEDAPCWRFCIRRFSIEPMDLIAAHHRENFELAGEAASGRSLQVISVEETGKEEEVFCAIEPETHTFVINNGLLTGNCHASGWDVYEPQAHFTFLFDALMQGGGVGANYSNRYLEGMPSINRHIDLHIVCREDHPDLHEFQELLCAVTTGDVAAHSNVFKVEDSREGWVSSVEELMKTAWSKPTGLVHPAHAEPSDKEVRLVIDVSDIRRRNSPLKTSGGIACGPGPLVKMLSNLVKHLNGCYGRQLTSDDAMTIDHTLADCVVAGGKRRSSRMSIKNWMDHDIYSFINCKRTDGAHWTTNISVEIDSAFHKAYAEQEDLLHDHARAVMRAIVLGMRVNGEPGFWDIDLARKGEREPGKMYCPNPCGEICLQMWENCNLGHINMEFFANKPKREMMEAFRLMTRWLVRATNGDIPNKRQRAVVDKNRRISVGFFGFHGFLSLRGVKYSEAWRDGEVVTVLSQAHNVVIGEGTGYSVAMGQPIPVQFTGLAPTGSVASLAGTSTSGQTIEYPWYKRRVRYADGDPELKVKQLEGYLTYPDDDAQNTTIVEYWCENPLISKVKANGGDPDLIEGQGEVSVENYLQMQAMLQEIYVDNAISFTIPLSEKNMPGEEEMEKSIVAVLGRVKGCTMYPDKSRKNSPFEALTREQFESYTGRKEITQAEAECKGGCPV